jgi:hypothetical protein
MQDITVVVEEELAVPATQQIQMQETLVLQIPLVDWVLLRIIFKVVRPVLVWLLVNFVVEELEEGVNLEDPELVAHLTQLKMQLLIQEVAVVLMVIPVVKLLVMVDRA